MDHDKKNNKHHADSKKGELGEMGTEVPVASGHEMDTSTEHSETTDSHRTKENHKSDE